jgi:3-isopropylmalate/(R)-2-methylmalate dehydratase small subunit
MAPERITRITGKALPIRGNNVDTDRILPARFLKSITFAGLEEHLFEDDRAQAGAAHPVSNPAYADAVLMLVNANFGCGSSREHAPQAIRRRGTRAVVGESFSEIFFGNSMAIGMPCPTVSADAAVALQAAAEQQPDTMFHLDLEQMTIACGSLTFAVSLPANARDALLTGSWDATGLLLERYDEVRAVAARLPYVTGNFSS